MLRKLFISGLVLLPSLLEMKSFRIFALYFTKHLNFNYFNNAKTQNKCRLEEAIQAYGYGQSKA
jgi:hypothetical protein